MAGPEGVHICDDCIDVCREILEDAGAYPEPANSSKEQGGGYQCSFCGKRSDEVKRMIAGPDLAICDECVRRFQVSLE